MKAIQIHSHGNIDVLKINQLDEPKCSNDKILVHVKACALLTCHL